MVHCLYGCWVFCCCCLFCVDFAFVLLDCLFLLDCVNVHFPFVLWFGSIVACLSVAGYLRLHVFSCFLFAGFGFTVF